MINPILYGSNPEEKIVAVHPSNDRSMRVYVRNSDGLASSDVEFYPFFFLSNPKYLKDFHKKHWIKELSGSNYYKYLCAFDGWVEMWEAIRYVLERYNENAPVKLDSYTELPILHVRTDPVAQFLKQTGRTLFKGLEFRDLKRFQIKIITSTKRGFKSSNPHRGDDRIIVIALSDNTGWEQVIGAKRITEKKMLTDLIKIIIERDPDIIEGYNIFNVDLPYILTRCEMNGVECSIGRDGTVPRAFDTRLAYTERSLDYTSYEIAGRHIIDISSLLKSSSTHDAGSEPYDLNQTAQRFRFTDMERIPQERISWFADNDPDKLIRYGIDRVAEIRKLSELLSPPQFYLAQMIPFNYGTIARLGTNAKIEALLLREYIRQKHSLPRPEIGSLTSGSYADIFYRGIFGPIVSIDVESIYSFVILSENITPRTDTLGVFLSLLELLSKIPFQTRIKSSDLSTEQLINNFIQSGFRKLINSFYDYLGYNRGLFNDYRAADTVAASCKDIIHRLIPLITEWDGKVVQVESDSFYFVPPKSNGNQIHENEFIEKNSRSLSSKINLQSNGRYQRMLCYKKKNYALLGYDQKLKIVGSSLLSKTSEKYGKDFIRLCIEALLNNDIGNIHNDYVRLNKLITSHQWTEKEFSRTEVLRETQDEYTNSVANGTRNRSAVYEVALNTGVSWKPGDRVSYYFTGEDANIKGFENCKLAEDWDSNFPDENVPYYLKRLDEYAKKFEDFFTEKDFHAIFSIDDLFGFSATGIKILTTLVEPEGKEYFDEEPDLIRVDPKIWLDES